ncbi:CHAT domain-containing protein [Nonomuraea sp. NPDC050451]|uniref:CHAT domain-containing protein n=1 Tax=Nonomuraea sp. NPDC050451 TaxID=3364364 RepID=UPI003794CCB4
MTGFDAALRAGRIEDALRLAEESVARGGPEVAGAFRDLARARIRVGQLPAAVAAAEKGLHNDTGAYEPELRMVLADAYERLGEFACAEALCVQVSKFVADLPYTLERFTTLVHRNVATARLNERRGQLHRAAYLLKATLIAGRQATAPASEAVARAAAVAFFGEIEHLVHLHLGRVARKLGDPELARTELSSALAGARAIGDAEVMMQTHVEFALLAGGPAEGLNHLLEALWWHESPLSAVRDDELRAAVRSTREELFQHAIDQAYACGAGAMVWRLSEHARARVFLARMRLTPPVPAPDTRGQRARASREVVAAARKFSARPGQRRHDHLVKALETKERIVLGDSPGPFAPRPWGAGTGVLEFFVSESRLYSFLTTADEARLFDLPLRPDVLNRKVTQLRQLLESQDSGVTRLAEQLHRWLIEPGQEVIDRLERLVIIPYGVLAYLPFAMLGGEQSLVERVDVSYAPSAAILDQLLRRTPAPLRNMMIMANPHPDDDELALPYSEDESRRIAALLDADTATGQAVTTAAFRAALTTHDVVHLACHAWFDPHEPRDSGLLLAEPGDPRRPGRVTVAELNDHRARARLVVLSGCQTGLADLTPGGELDGLVRAFLTAGVPSVVASLWRVDDRVTADLMLGLYGALSDGLDVAAALRRAQLAVRADTSHPYYWASFCQFGSWLTAAG